MLILLKGAISDRALEATIDKKMSQRAAQPIVLDEEPYYILAFHCKSSISHALVLYSLVQLTF
jgi:hypothetical protein